MNNKALFLIAFAATLAGCTPAPQDDPQRPSKPEGTTASSFLLNEIGYECSQPIAGEWKEASVGQLGSPEWYFHPSNEEDFKKYCRSTYAIEYHSVLQILKKPDVVAVIARYDTTQAWVRALSHDYIDDKSYIARILPTFDAATVDCIIVVHSPEGTRFFVENGAVHENHGDHRYVEVPAAAFLASLNAASDEDVTNFWLGLR